MGQRNYTLYYCHVHIAIFCVSVCYTWYHVAYKCCHHWVICFSAVLGQLLKIDSSHGTNFVVSSVASEVVQMTILASCWILPYKGPVMRNVWTSSWNFFHNNDVIMSMIASQITSLISVYSTVYLGADQRKHQSSASLAFVWGSHRDRYKGPVTRKMLPFDDVIMCRWFLSVYLNNQYITFMLFFIKPLDLCSVIYILLFFYFWIYLFGLVFLLTLV